MPFIEHRDYVFDGELFDPLVFDAGIVLNLRARRRDCPCDWPTRPVRRAERFVDGFGSIPSKRRYA